VQSDPYSSSSPFPETNHDKGKEFNDRNPETQILATHHKHPLEETTVCESTFFAELSMGHASPAVTPSSYLTL